MNTYNYNIPELDLIQIMDEIYTSLNKKLYASYPGETVDGYCDYFNPNLSIVFYNNLNPTEQGILTDLISNYVYDADYCEHKKFKINNSTDDPSDIDYDILGLHKKRTIIFGELRETEYYKNYTPSSQTYSDLIIKEFRDYTRDVNGLVQFRTQTSIWYLNDNSSGATKTTTKYYTLPESIQEGVDRRGNVIAQAKAYVLANIGQLYSFDLLTSVKNEIQLFLDGYTQPLRDSVSASTKPYLNTTLKENIIENLRLS